MCVCARARNPRAHPLHRTQRLLSMSCRKSNHHHSNLIWVQSVLTAISFIKTVRYRVLFKACGSHSTYWLKGNLGGGEGGLEPTGANGGQCVFGTCVMTVLMVTHTAHTALVQLVKKTIKVWEHLSVWNWRCTYTWSNNKNQTIWHRTQSLNH